MHNSIEIRPLAMALELGRMKIPALELIDWEDSIESMRLLESGEIANPDEGRRVGHYWLRNISMAPKEEAKMIEDSWKDLKKLLPRLSQYSTLLMVGIGGSALGPQFLAEALPGLSKRLCFLDNTDPQGIDRVLSGLDLKHTAVAVLSKSGGTKETRNALLECRDFFKRAEVDFACRAIAVTTSGSILHSLAIEEQWLGVLPLWPWVGGRSSITGMVGLLPLAFLGRDWQALLRGASAMDESTRPLSKDNLALQMAHAWHSIGDGVGRKAMVVLPYKDSLSLLGRYLQQ